MATGLLGPTPEAVRMAERQALMTQFMNNPEGVVAASIFGLGRSLGNVGVEKAFGIETDSAQVQQSRKIKDATEGLDLSTFEGVMEASKRIQDIDPERALGLAKFANDNLNVFTDKVIWTKDVEGVIVPQIVSEDKKGNKKISLGAGIQTMGRVNDIAKSKLVDKPDKYSGQNIRIGNEVKPVWLDANGQAYIKDPALQSEENPFGKNYQAVIDNTDGMFSSNEERTGAGTKQRQIFAAITRDIITDVQKDKTNFLERWLNGLDDEEIRNLAFEVESVAAEMWKDEETKKLYNNNRFNLVRSLVKDYFEDQKFFNGPQEEGGGDEGTVSPGAGRVPPRNDTNSRFEIIQIEGS